VSVFEYLSVFVSIIIGLGVTNVLIGLARILGGKDDRTSVAHTCWIYLVLLFLSFFWWFSFDWRLQETWTFGLFLWVVAYSMLTFLLAALVIPRERPPEGDWGEDFFRRRRTFFSVWALIYVVDTADALLKGPENYAQLGIAFLVSQSVGFSLAMVLSRTNRRTLFTALSMVWVVYLTVTILRFADVFFA
jgi:hypothetical protein